MQNYLTRRAKLVLVAAAAVISYEIAQQPANRSAIALFTGAGEVARGYQSAASGSLTCSLPSQNKTVGHFTVKWDAARAQLQFEHNGRLIGGSVPGESFIAAQQVTSSIVGEHGDFNLMTDVRQALTDQGIDAIEATDDAVTLKGHVAASGAAWPYTMTVRSVSRSQMAIDIQLLDDAAKAGPSTVRTVLKLASDADEQFYGFGSQTQLSQKGRVVPIMVREQGHGRGKEPRSLLMNARYPGIAGTDESSYAPVPFYVTSRKHGVFLENTDVALFDMRDPHRVEISVVASRLQARLISAPTFQSVLESYTEYTGRQRALPAWVNQGAIIGMQGGTQRVRQKWQVLQDAHVPLAAFWLQDWEGQLHTPNGDFLQWNWVLSDSTYPGFADMARDLRQSGIRTMTYFNPFLSRDVNVPPGVPHYFNEAAAKHLLVEDEHKQPYERRVWQGNVGLLDLTNPATRDFIKDILKDHMRTLHVSGWMGDFGEALPFDGILHDGSSPWAYHNAYAQAWAQVQHEAVAELGLLDEVVFFNRSAFTRSPSFTPLFWLGDQMVDWDRQDGLKTVVPMLISSGLSGFAINHGDIGGYLGVDRWPLQILRSKELFMRWAELAAFTSAFRTHEGSQPQGNHQFDSDAETLAHFGRCARIYASLAGYRNGLFLQAQEVGYPVVRPLFFHYPDDPQTYALDAQFMLGENLIVVPVMDAGVTRIRAYLPAGSWKPFFGGEVLHSKGEWVEVDAPLGKPAVFIRGESGLAGFSE